MSTSITASATPVIDPFAILDRFEGDVDLVRDVVELFLQDCPRRLAALREAVILNDGKALQFTAHSIKGSVGNFSAAAAVTAALRLEMIGRRGDLTDAPQACAVLEKEIARLAAALAHLVSTIEPDGHVHCTP